MPSTTNGPFPLLSGQQTQVPTPQGGGGQGTAFGVVLFNNSSATLQVNAPGGSRLLLPLTADIFVGPGVTQGTVQVTPITPSLQNGIYLGTIQAMWGATKDDIPGAYPTPLPIFPGGAFQFLGALVFGGGPPVFSFPQPFIRFAPPSGFGGFLFRNFTYSGIGTNTFTLTGDQTGTTYFNSTTVANGADLIIPIIDPTDYSFSLTYTGDLHRGGSFSGAFALPANAVPQFATAANSVSGSGTLVAAPAAGTATYVFDADLAIGGGAADGASIFDGSTLIAQMAADGVTAPTTGPIADHTRLSGKRCTGAITVTVGVATTRTTLRYAIGP